MKNYIPKHEVTENYSRGMKLIFDNDLYGAIDAFLQEPVNSSCYGLAIGNLALCYLRLDKFKECETYSLLLFQKIGIDKVTHKPSIVQFGRNYSECIMNQGRFEESMKEFNDSIHLGNQLIHDFPDDEEEIKIQIAHTFNSWGGALLRAGNHRAAIDVYESALNIYNNHRITNTVGLPEVYTNRASAFLRLGDFIRAELSLLEALELASKDICDKADQIYRIKTLLIEMGSSKISEDPLDFFKEASAYALDNDRLETGLIRLAIGIHYFLELKKPREARELVNIARIAKKKVTFPTEYSANIRLLEAGVLQMEKSDNKDILDVLFDGATDWYKILNRKFQLGDFGIQTMKMKNIFQFLALELLEIDRTEEALMAIEYSRAISYALEHHDTSFNQIIDVNPFEKGKVNVDVLKRLQSELKNNDLIISLCLIENRNIAFLISRESVGSINLEIPQHNTEEYYESLGLIPEALHQGKEDRSFPKEIFKFTEMILKVSDGKEIKLVFPYSILHKVPWRNIFMLSSGNNSLGPISIGLGLIPYILSKNNSDNFKNYSISLGHGKTQDGALDLIEEARLFSNEINGDICPSFTRAELLNSFKNYEIVHLSCHGNFLNINTTPTLLLSMGDGDFPLEEYLPQKILSKIVILSACTSGVYEMAYSEHPIGAAPLLLGKGAKYVIGTRYPVNAYYAKEFIFQLAKNLNRGFSIEESFSHSILTLSMDARYSNLRNLCSFEIFK